MFKVYLDENRKPYFGQEIFSCCKDLFSNQAKLVAFVYYMSYYPIRQTMGAKVCEISGYLRGMYGIYSVWMHLPRLPTFRLVLAQGKKEDICGGNQTKKITSQKRQKLNRCDGDACCEPGKFLQTTEVFLRLRNSFYNLSCVP